MQYIIKFFGHQAYSKAVAWKYSVKNVFSKIKLTEKKTVGVFKKKLKKKMLKTLLKIYSVTGDFLTILHNF